MPIQNYDEIVEHLKKRIRESKTRAVLSVNAEMLSTYWEIGKTILLQQSAEGWGTKVVDRLVHDLKAEFPGMKGLSLRNVKYMRAFAEAFPDLPVVQTPVAQIQARRQTLPAGSIVQPPIAQISWSHHIVLLDKVKDGQATLFYIGKTVENGWTRDMLINQIANGLHRRQGALSSNFSRTIVPLQSETVQQLFKDPYMFDFLQLDEQARERDLENALLTHITDLLLELGDGFTFKSRQYRLEAGDQEYFLDLLFYHTKLRRYIVIELLCAVAHNNSYVV